MQYPKSPLCLSPATKSPAISPAVSAVASQGMGNSLRFSAMGPTLSKPMLAGQPLDALGEVLNFQLGVFIASCLPGDMGLRLGDLVFEFLDLECQAGRLPK